MLTLTFNGCSRSDVSVTPKNWKTKKASISKPWKIYYRFYDPAFKDTPSWGKQFAIRGMNDYATLEDRQKVTRILIDDELRSLDELGFNPITEQYMAPAVEEQDYEINPNALFIDALWSALKKVDAISDVLTDIRSVINGVAAAANQLVDSQHRVRYDALPISMIRTKHLKHILERCGKLNPRWSNNRYNKYKAYLSMLFTELVQVEAVDSNWTRDIPYKKKMKRIKSLLTVEEQQLISDHLKARHYYFWRYMQIYYRSGSRTTELLSLQKNEKINLERQEFIVLVKKGAYYSESIRPIPNDILPLWKEVWEEARPGQFLFSRLLKPGNNKIRKDQPGRRWTKYVKADKEKGGLGIKKEFYWLKSLHTDTIAAKVDLEHAQVSTGHTSEKMVMVYAIGENQRRLDKLKNTVVKFGN